MARRVPATDHDASRREFFKVFSRQTIQNAGAVAGAAAEIRRTSLATARELLDMDKVEERTAPKARTVVEPRAEADAPQDTFRSPYRFTGTSLVVLDQRELPERIVTFDVGEVGDVATAMRSGAITPGPVLGQVAAYGIALAATNAVDRNEGSRDQVVNAAAGALKAARGEAHVVAHAAERMVARYGGLANDGASGAEIAQGLVAEADALATESTAACAEIGRRWSGLVVGDDLNVVLHGDAGPLACGMVGMATSGLQLLVDAGRRLHVWVPRAEPSGEGIRISALELTRLGIAHTVIPDSAIGWLFASRPIDAVVLRGDTISANGDVVALLGARAVAQVAADSATPIHVLAPDEAWDRGSPDASHLVLNLRSAAELGSADRARLEPPFDVVPARFVSAFVSQTGVVGSASLEANS